MNTLFVNFVGSGRAKDGSQGIYLEATSDIINVIDTVNNSWQK